MEHASHPSYPGYRVVAVEGPSFVFGRCFLAQLGMEGAIELAFLPGPCGQQSRAAEFAHHGV